LSISTLVAVADCSVLLISLWHAYIDMAMKMPAPANLIELFIITSFNWLMNNTIPRIKRIINIGSGGMVQ